MGANWVEILQWGSQQDGKMASLILHEVDFNVPATVLRLPGTTGDPAHFDATSLRYVLYPSRVTFSVGDDVVMGPASGSAVRPSLLPGIDAAGDPREEARLDELHGVGRSSPFFQAGRRRNC